MSEAIDTSGDIATEVVSDDFCKDYCDVTPEWAAARDVARRWRTQSGCLSRTVGEVKPISQQEAACLGADEATLFDYAYYAAEATTNYDNARDVVENGRLVVIVPLAPIEAYLPDYYDDGYGENPLAFIKAFRTALQWLKNTPILFAFVPDEIAVSEEASHAEAPA